MDADLKKTQKPLDPFTGDLNALSIGFIEKKIYPVCGQDTECPKTLDLLSFIPNLTRGNKLYRGA